MMMMVPVVRCDCFESPRSLGRHVHADADADADAVVADFVAAAAAAADSLPVRILQRCYY